MRIYSFIIDYDSYDIYKFKIIENVHNVIKKTHDVYDCGHGIAKQSCDIGKIFSYSYYDDWNCEDRSIIGTNILFEDYEEIDKLKYKTKVIQKYYDKLANLADNIIKTLEKLKGDKI